MQYLEAISLIHSLDLDDSLKTLLIDRAYHLEFCKLIKAGDTSSALELLSAVDLSAGQRDTLCQELVLQKSSKNA